MIKESGLVKIFTIKKDLCQLPSLLGILTEAYFRVLLFEKGSRISNDKTSLQQCQKNIPFKNSNLR
jgi:hypothetical protein